MRDDADRSRLEALVEAGITLAAEPNLDSLLFRIADLARQIVGAAYGAVGVVSETGDLSRFVYSGIDDATAKRIGDLPTGRGVLGVVLEQSRPLRLADISEHPRSVGFPAHHPTMRTFLGAPIMARGTVFGRLYLTEKDGGGQFSEQDERIAMMLAAQAGVAIENASLYEEVHARGEELGRRLAQMASFELVARMLLAERTTTDEVLRSAVEEARLLTGGTRATLMMLDATSGELRIRHAVGWDEMVNLEGVVLAPGSSKSHAVIERLQADTVDDLMHDPEINAHVLEVLGDPANGAFAPLLVRERPVGALAVYGSADGKPFTADDLSILQILANQAAIALENDRLNFLLRNMAVLEERERISKELHDGVIQSIYSVGLNLQASLSLLGSQPERAAQRIEDAIRELDNVVRDVRNYIFELRPRVMEERGLEAALVELVRELEVNTMAHSTIELAPTASAALSPEEQAHVIQIAREILSNVARHAQASNVRVTANIVDGSFVLAVEDDGLGYDPATVRRGQGLNNMQARAEAVGGKLEVVPGAERGTRHVVWVPLQVAE